MFQWQSSLLLIELGSQGCHELLDLKNIMPESSKLSCLDDRSQNPAVTLVTSHVLHYAQLQWAGCIIHNPEVSNSTCSGPSYNRTRDKPTSRQCNDSEELSFLNHCHQQRIVHSPLVCLLSYTFLRFCILDFFALQIS